MHCSATGPESERDVVTMSGDGVTTAEGRTKYERAESIRTELWGSDHLDRLALLQSNAPRLFEIVLNEGFGNLYADPRISLRDRAVATISALVATGKFNQAQSHMEAALRLGMNAEELVAILSHLFLYLGLPPVIEGIRILSSLPEGDPQS